MVDGEERTVITNLLCYEFKEGWNMRYSNYDIQENDDNTWTAFEPNTSNELATARYKCELENLMANLDRAFEEGIVQGVKEHKEEMRNKLGL